MKVALHNAALTCRYVLGPSHEEYAPTLAISLRLHDKSFRPGALELRLQFVVVIREVEGLWVEVVLLWEELTHCVKMLA
jgi:hypothetical protein